MYHVTDDKVKRLILREFHHRQDIKLAYGSGYAVCCSQKVQLYLK